MKNISVEINNIVEKYRRETVQLLRDLVRIPSVNHPPTGDEAAVQKFYAGILRASGLETEILDPIKNRRFMRHPARLKSHDMHNRPNVVGRLKGTGDGRSLMLLAHADVEQTGDCALWTGGNPFSGRLYKGRVYGRGAADDKSGMAVNAMAARIIRENGFNLRGDLIVASVADEEQAGSNGILALLCRGVRADACLNIDGANLDIAVAGLGGGCCTVDITVPGSQTDAAVLLNYFDLFRKCVADLAKERIRIFKQHTVFKNPKFTDMGAVKLTNIMMATDDMTHGRFSFWFYLLPGENPVRFKKRVENALRGIKHAGTFRIEWPQRILPAGETPLDHPFVKCATGSYRRAGTGKPTITGSFMSDMGMVTEYGGFPCLNFGPGRVGVEGALHQPDEFVEVEEVMRCLKTAVNCAVDWCR